MLALCVVGLSAACVRVQRTTTPAGAIPPQLLGSWVGSWQSGQGPGSGGITLDLQAFTARPVVHVEIDNPCLPTAQYSFAVTAERWELRAEGVPVFVATLDPSARMLTGHYECHDDHGTWTARWTHELPPVGDLSGLWTGSARVVGLGVESPMELELSQQWRQGLLRLDGHVRIPALQLDLLIAEGQVDWLRDRVDLQLRTEAESAPEALLQGSGAPEGDLSGFVVIDDPRVPFSTAVWRVQRLQ
jgi:hypothetical protein